MSTFLHAATAGSPLATAIACVVGLAIGSFLNVVIARLPLMMHRAWDNYLAQANKRPLPHSGRFNLVSPRSHCQHCKKPVRPADNIPVISYLLLKGRCTHCKTTITARYPLTELAGAILSGAVVWHIGYGLHGIAALLFCYFMIMLFCIDAETMLLPDPLTLPLIWLGLLVNINGTFTSLPSAVLGAVLGYLVLWCVYWLFKLATGKEGMGYGDFKLLSAIGAWLGWQMLPLLLLCAASIGAIAGLSMIALGRHQKGAPMPFGPYLAASAILGLFFGQPLLEWLFTR